ncbi:tetratricopeptide repeat protein [Vibrio sp. 10N.286.46.A8]|uniref:tetratricopeptide repeat protein n=1 Tax=Vibrio sp. 10N.286.46.A8 TaxID=3229697 RepID=UPI0035545C76
MDNEQEWSLTGFLDELKRIHETMPDRRFVFILGAGASIESNVKGAASLAKEWMKIIFRRNNNEDEYDNWLQGNPLQIKGWDANNLAAHYPQIFSFCFNGDHESGYAELEKAIDQGSPSFGYAVLAWVLAQDRHNMVVTTNFDNLVADSMYIYGGKTPLVIGHESLASYLKPMSRRPMIAKIHRDLFTDPINDEKGVGELKSDWVDALKNIFSFYTPVFIGYGGNDGSLMNFLSDLETNDISGRPFWCYYEKGDKPNGDIKELMVKHKGVLVPTPGFDQLMFKIGSTWGYERGTQRGAVAAHTTKMLDTLDQKIQEVYNDSPTEVREKLREVNSQEEKSWLDWEFEAAEKKSDQEKLEVYKQALLILPTSYQLLYNYANLLMDLDMDDEAEKSFSDALKVEPENTWILGNYAGLLEKLNRDEEAEKYYKNSLAADSVHINTIGNYANLLHKLDRLDEAEQYYKKALEIDPNNSNILGNYANFLDLCGRVEEAQKYYLNSLEIDPDSPYHSENYNNFLARLNKDT